MSYIGLGRACVAENPHERPSFTEVQSLIEGIRLEAASAKLQAPPPSLAQAPGLRGHDGLIKEKECLEMGGDSRTE